MLNILLYDKDAKKNSKASPGDPLAFLRWFFAIPELVKDKDYTEKYILVPVFINDILFTLNLVMLAWGLIFLPVMVAVDLHEARGLWSAIEMFGLLLLSIVLWLTVFERIPRDILAARQFLGPNRYFTNCYVFHLRIPHSMYGWRLGWHFSPVTKLVRFPAGQRPFKTSAVITDPRALKVQLKQGGIPGNGGTSAAKFPEGNSDSQIVILQAVYQLALGFRPETIARAYNAVFSRNAKEDTRTAMERGMQTVDKQVEEILISYADAILQQFTVDQLLTTVGEVNYALMNGVKDPKDDSKISIEGLKSRLLEIGVDLVTIAVEDVEDVIPENGYKALRSAYIQAENSMKQRVRAAEADKIGGIAQREARLEILKIDNTLFKQQLENEKIIAKTLIQKLQARLKLLEGKHTWMPAAMQALVQLSPEQQVDFVRALGDALEGAGIKIGGSLFLGGSDSGRLLDATPLGGILGPLQEVLKSFGMLPSESARQPLPM